MSEAEAFRICPRCGSQEVPTLIVGLGRPDGIWSSWQCHACRFIWSDAEQHHPQAS
jgi:transposase-like protein